MAPIIQYSFKRYEKKYFLSPEKYEQLLEGIRPYMKADAYGLSSICNIYYDTPNWELVRASIEKPVFKEKLRMRSYGVPKDGDRVFGEIKRKCRGVVYKRRIEFPAERGAELLQNPGLLPSGQIESEIAWFQAQYHAQPRVFLAYDRIAYAGIFDPELRITFDTRLRYREDELDLRLGDRGEPLIDTGDILMEIKIPGTCPLWLAELLSRLSVYPTSFSKYGHYFTTHILNETTKKEDLFYA